MDRKHIVLDILKNSNRAISLFDLYKDAQGSIPERTLRRYLEQLKADRLIEFTGGNRNRRYRAIYTQENTTSGHPIFSEQSLGILKQLNVPMFQREPRSYNFAWLEQYIPNKTNYFTTEDLNILYRYGKQTLDAEPTGTVAHKIYERLLIDLSYNSSRLEGNTYSLSDTKLLLLEGRAAQDKLDSEKIMILNHKDAIAYLINNIENININYDTIKTIHYLLSDGLVPANLAGSVRNEGVKVSGSVYMPLDNAGKITDILNIIVRKTNQITDPYEQSIFLLIHSSYLQAFIDVNKRTARLISIIPLLKNNLIPISFSEIDVTDYRNAIISIYESNKISPLKDLYMGSYIRTAKEYAVTIESLGFDALRVKYRPQRRSLLGKIIKEKIKNDFEKIIKEFSTQQIPAPDQNKFVLDVLDDLKVIDTSKIVGLGVTKQEFIEWQLLQSTEKSR